MMKTQVNIIGPLKSGHSASVIFFHGSGDTGLSLIERIRYILGKDIEFDHIKLIFPTAPLQQYTAMGGQTTHIWFDRHAVNIASLESKKSLGRSYEIVHKLIETEVAQGIPYNRIIVGGFSMGGALALHTAYHLNTSLAAAFAWSSFLNRDSIVYESLANISSINKLPDLKMFHGVRDTLVPIEWGKESFNYLVKFGVRGKFTPIKNALHELKKRELIELQAWILEKLPALNGNIQNKL